MFKRFRRLRISLAAKCQILFGASVVLIIAAALAVPWQRMERLTLQLNERAAGALAENALAEHILNQRASAAITPDTQPATSAPDSGQRPATPRGLESLIPQLISSPPRLLPISAANDDARAKAFSLSAFERRAIGHFRRHPDAAPYPDSKADPEWYRFAQPVYLTKDCAACHVQSTGSAVTLTPSATLSAAAPSAVPATGPTTAPVIAGATPTTFPVSPSLVPDTAPVAALPATEPAATRFVPLSVERSRLVGIVSVEMPTRVQENQLLLNRVFIMAAGLLAGSLAILCFYLITTRLILQPVRVLQETAEKVSKGDLNIRSDINTGDEFQQLAETFNVMLANLKQTTDQLRSINKSLDLKLGQLAEANLALYESNRLKSEFLANVSHELRTPLNSILGFADLLKDAMAQGSATDAKSGRFINNILVSGRNLLDLINDLLDLAKIEAGRMEVRSEPLSLTDLFEGLVSILKPLCEPKRLSIFASTTADVPILHSDPGKLQQVLYNFLANAIKFSPDGARIELLAQREAGTSSRDQDEDYVRISVTDAGPGIASEKQQVIFEKFRQVDASVTRTHGGSGLGLAISKELTSLIGGTIGVRSIPGQGATFWVLIPVRIEASTQDVRGRLVLS